METFGQKSVDQFSKAARGNDELVRQAISSCYADAYDTAKLRVSNQQVLAKIADLQERFDWN